jgi:hypothetical protein
MMNQQREENKVYQEQKSHLFKRMSLDLAKAAQEKQTFEQLLKE